MTAADQHVSKRLWAINGELQRLAGRTENYAVRNKILRAIDLIGGAWVFIRHKYDATGVAARPKKPRSKRKRMK